MKTAIDPTSALKDCPGSPASWLRAAPGDALDVILTSADPVQRRLLFTPVESVPAAVKLRR